MDITEISAIANLTNNVIDKIFPDKAQAAFAKEQLKQSGDLAVLERTYKLAELDNQDRDSARKREMEVKDRMPAILAFGITIGFFSVLFYILNYDIAEKSRDIANIMLGSLGAGFTGVLGYYFGSSAASNHKTNIINKITDR